MARAPESRPSPPRRWRRIVLGGLSAVAVTVAVAAATLPWWWPAVVVQVVDGVDFKRANASGWSTVELHDVHYVRDGLEVTAASVRVPAFGLWPQPGATAAIEAEDIVIALQASRWTESTPPSVYRVVADILKAWPTLERWLPSARVRRVTVVPVGENATPVEFDEVRWDGERLSVLGAVPGRDHVATVSLRHPAPAVLELAASVPELRASGAAVARLGEDELVVDASSSWDGIRGQATATFGLQGIIPTRASVEAPDVTLPAALIGLPAYGPITGTVSANWSDRTYSGVVTAQATPVDPAAQLPPLRIDVRATGNFQHVRIDSAEVRIPGVDANLSSPLALALPKGVPEARAEFTLAIDLAKLPQTSAVAARGTVTGRLQVAGGPNEAPAATFSLSGKELHWRDGEVPAIEVTGQWNPDRLRISRGHLEIGEASELDATGELDLRTKEIVQAAITGDLAGAALRPWWPQVPEFARATIEASATGPWNAPEHAGKIGWRELSTPLGLIAGEGAWQGQGLESATIDGTLHGAGEISVPLAADVQRGDDGTWRVDLTRLRWEDAQGEWWRLARQADIDFGADGIRVAGVELAGEKLALAIDADISWPARGHVSVSGHDITAARLAPLLARPDLPATLEHVTLEASWNNGPVGIDGSARASYAAKAGTSYALAAEFRSESENLVFGAVRVFSPAGVVLEGSGRLPLFLAGREEGFEMALPQDGPMSLELASTPNPEFWSAVTAATGWEIGEPVVHVQLQGPLSAPEGRVELAAETLQPPPGVAAAGQLPRIGDLDVVAAADADGLRLEKAIWTIDGHWVSLQGRVPWAVARSARESGAVPWRDVDFSFAADRLPMAIASRAVPRVLAPDGTVSFKIDHEPGAGFDGRLWLTNVGLRPIQPLGAVRDIGGQVSLEGYQVGLHNVAAYLGGRPVELGGGADLTNWDQPTFDLFLVSSRVPLVRQEGLVVRAGLNLRVQQQAGEPARVSGSAELGRSVFVSDLVGLLPSGSVERPEQRPPFFSVPAAPFAEWQLEVHVTGSDFLQIQSPFFRSELSADFSLSGTLENPRAHGRAWTNEGTIIFPFGSLEVQNAEVSLTPEDPHTLALRAAAETRLYGYNLRLDVSGSAQEPRLQFSSEPPLSSQQVFLMLSAGELPDADNSFSSSERARRLAWFVGRNLASTFGLGGGEGDGRLEVRSGEDFSREGAETIYVQYDLDEHWSIVGEQDRFDAYNFGIKYRIVDK